mgnify:CR=1 FL=1
MNAPTPTHRPALSMLDLVAVREGGTVAQALQIALRTAQHAEKLGFARYWLAEHHNMPGIASSATAVLVGYIAAGTFGSYLNPLSAVATGLLPLVEVARVRNLARMVAREYLNQRERLGYPLLKDAELRRKVLNKEEVLNHE